MQAVSVYFVFNCIRSLIYSIWEAVSETFHCKFMLSSKSMYIIFCASIIIVYINTWYNLPVISRFGQQTNLGSQIDNTNYTFAMAQLSMTSVRRVTRSAGI